MYEVETFNSPNYSSRSGYKPILFVIHITDGESAERDDDDHEERAVHNTFMNPAEQASSNDCIMRDGRIKQYVDIRKSAWTQGLHGISDIQAAPCPIVRNMGINPNYYCYSVELLAYKDNGGDGNITEDQFWSLCWRLKCRQEEIKAIWGHKVPLNSTYIIGHCHIDPRNRKFDPGMKFPWTRLFVELAIADSMSIADYEGRVKMLRSPQLQQNRAFDIANEIEYLWNLSKQPTGEGAWARGILLSLHPVMTSLGLLSEENEPYDEEKSPGQVHNQALYMYNLGIGKNSDGTPAEKGTIEWAKNELLRMYPFMLQNGLV